MAIKKSQIYSTLWSSCDVLRGSMDASQYKDYVLMMLFVKYLSDKGNDADSLFTIPPDCNFSDFVALKGHEGIGEAINMKLEAIKSENTIFLSKLVLPNFNDPTKFGKAKEMTEILSKLIAVFETDALDFSKNRSADDDILGDAYEYLMKNFAAQSGKSKGQFYTPAEVSRTMAKMLHLSEFTSPSTTIYDPTCGSGSLLLRALGETPNGATPFGQEKDNTTASLAILNMLLHGIDTATIEQGDTINNPQFLAGGTLATFDVCIANPPFSTKEWLGAAGEDDVYRRWNRTMCPPAKCGDYAFLLHLIASMKTGTGRGACILPHGVLFRGNAEYAIRRHIVESGCIEGIVGLPANIFFGTGIPACILLINKKGAANREGIFFIDAKDGFMKDGAKNRLREQDIKYIVDTWEERKDVPHYARFVKKEEIVEKNDYNLNIPRYITARDTEIQQDIDAHLHGGLPRHDIDQMEVYWKACTSLRDALFSPLPGREGYFTLNPEKEETSSFIATENSFLRQQSYFEQSIVDWSGEMQPRMLDLSLDIKPKNIIETWSQALLDAMQRDKSLVNAYDTYEQLMAYWNDTLQDDCYMISRDGWKLTLLKGEKNTSTYEDMSCDLLPVEIVLKEFFSTELDVIASLLGTSEIYASQLQELIEKAKEDADEEDEEELKHVINKTKKTLAYKAIDTKKKEVDKKIKEKKQALILLVESKYAAFTEEETKSLVVDKKWLAAVSSMIHSEMQQITLQLSSEVIAIAERYEHTLASLDKKVVEMESKVNKHLKKFIKKGAMQKLLTGEVRLAGFTEPWVEKRISEACTIKARIGWQGLKSDEYLDYGNYVLITGTDFENGFINWAKCSYVSKERFEQDENIKY